MSGICKHELAEQNEQNLENEQDENTQNEEVKLIPACPLFFFFIFIRCNHALEKCITLISELYDIRHFYEACLKSRCMDYLI